MTTRNAVRDKNLFGSSLEALEGRLFLSAQSHLGGYLPVQWEPVDALFLAASPKAGTITTTDDFGNISATAWGVVLDSTGAASVNGQINYASDADVFFLIPSKDGQLSLKLTAIVNKRISISGDLSAYTDTAQMGQDATAADTGATLTFDVKAGTKYYVRVASLNGQSGKYTLGFSEVWVTPPPPPPPPSPSPAGNYTPGTAVTWQVENASDGPRLVVLGTDGADAITVSKASGNTVIYVSGAAVWTTSQVFASVQLYGFGGDDTLVSISGASETVYGGTGLDSFWVDSRDTIGDSDAAESAAKSLHTVSGFYSSTYVAQPSLELAGQNLADPAASYPYANFSSGQVFTDGPEYNDIRQGAVGDCYFLAVLSSLAQSDPGVIRQMIAPLGDGTYAVRFFANGQASYVRVDGDLPVYSGSSSLAYAGLSPEGELWVALAEKAYAQFRTGANTYASIASGSMSPVYTQITAASAPSTYTSGITDAAAAAQIAQALADGHAVTAGSISSGSATIQGGHAYAVYSVQTVNGQQTVTVYNPWGYDGKGADGNSGDGLVTLSISDFRSAFVLFTVCAA